MEMMAKTSKYIFTHHRVDLREPEIRTIQAKLLEMAKIEVVSTIVATIYLISHYRC